MGPLRVWRDGVELDAGPRQQRCLLAVMLARAGRPVAMSDLISLLWGPRPPASAVNVIHKYIGLLRRLLEPDLPLRSAGSYLLRDGDGYRLVAGPEVLDLVAFRDLVLAAKSSLKRGRAGEALDFYGEAIRLCHGSAGGFLADSAMAMATFAGIDAEFFDAAIAAGEAAVQVRQPARVLAALRLAASMAPLNEPVHASLVTTLAAAGHQSEALAVYRAVRTRLANEMGIDPGDALQEAQRRTLTQATMPPLDEDVQQPIGDVAAENSETAPVGQPQSTLLTRPAQLPPDLSLFAGRNSELAVLRGLVAAKRDEGRAGPLVVALNGMGGVGKSTLATRFAHLAADEFGDGQLYLDLRGHLDPSDSVPADDALRSLLYGLGLPASQVPDTFDARVGVYRSLTAGKRVLILLDNVRDAAHVPPLLPNSPDGLVLVTSRRALVGLAAFNGAHLLRVNPPDMTEARELFQRRLARLSSYPGSDITDTVIVDEIIELCGRLPLALAILAARLAGRPGLPLATVAAELRDGACRLQAFPGERHMSNPRMAFSWSYRQLSPGAARLFRLLSLAPTLGATVGSCASLSGQSLETTKGQLEELTGAALVNEHGDGRFTAHVLVGAYARELLHATESQPERQAALSRLSQYYLHSSFRAQAILEPNRTTIPPSAPLPGVIPERPGSYDQALDWFDRHREILKDAVRAAADTGYGTVAWQLAITMRQYLQRGGYFQHWQDVTCVALHSARER